MKYVATLYAHGNQHYKLKPHKRNDFDKIFGPYLCFNDGNPEIIEQNGSFDFKAVLEGIVENCQRERTFLAVMGKKLQAGKIAEVLVKEANAFARGTRLRNIQGDVRKNISFRAVWDDGRSPVPFLNQAIGETGTFLDNCKKNQAHLNEVLSAKKDNLDKAKEELGLLTGKMDRIAGELKQEIFKCEDLFGPVIQKIIKHEKNEKNKQQSKAREKERLKIVEELSREVTRVVSHSSSFSKVVDELKENITGHLSNDLKVVIDCTLKIESNDELTLLHRLLAWRYPFLKSFKGNEPSCFTTMSGQKEACSGEWGVIEFTLAKCMFANAEKSSGLVSIPELILQNPFLKLYGHLQPTVEGSAQADVVDGAGASAAGISTEVKDVERELKAATAASRLISNIDAKLGGGKESKKEDLELIRAQVQSISDNRVLEKLFTWLMTQEYLWKTTGFSFTKTTMFGVEQYCRSTWGKIEQFFAKKMTTNSCRAALHGEHGTKGIDELVKGNPFLNKHRSLIEKMQKNFSLDDKESEAEGRIFERQQSTETSSIESSLDVSYASM
ncbi:hypothetical protein Psal070_02089 [Piscirickettsia salmonis]|uniref:hypothetical protein n=2 Tax=Piscirickettsia salmonis TaxID=1238 RepID=UPI0012B7145A|nr:hypothetical protein [Piscirickettsia salmonis]QGO56223.1 hypothetical protein Psal070_02089 [Piscirickettsia salmonis]